jgi:single-stranded-DNA-specific exonuclease
MTSPTLYHQGVKKKIVPRPDNKKKSYLNNLDPILLKIFSTRGITENEQIDRTLAKLPSPWLLSGMESMVEHLIIAIKQQQKICIVADFDADGATSCVVAIKGLKLLGVRDVSFVVPNRFKYEYGLTPELVELVKQQQPDIIITVDNGISSIEGVKVARDWGMKVLVTDHHLPGTEIPDADAIVNPNLPDDPFPSGNIAGVGVIFYVLMALRNRLRESHWFEQNNIQQPNLAQLLDYVALGTVADVVALDQVNRILVHQGLLRIQSGKSHAGIKALIDIAGKKDSSISSSDLGFALAPRLNAAGRMDDMSLGIQCLLTEDEGLAKELAEQLDSLNKERKEVEGQMKHQAMSLLEKMHTIDEKHLSAGVCLFEKDWHQGVIGILASRIKDRLHRPVIAFASTETGEIKGSARSIPGIHIRDV